MNYSTVWFNEILGRAKCKIDGMLHVTDKYCNFRGVS